MAFLDRRRSLALLAITDRFPSRVPAKELIKIDPLNQALRIHVRIPEQIGGIEWVVLFTSDKRQSRITVPAQECLAYIDAVVLEATRIGLILRVGEVIGREADPGKEAPIKFHFRIQTQTESPPRPRRHMVFAIGATAQSRGRIPARRARCRSWNSGSSRGLLRLLFTILVTYTKIPPTFH